MVKKILHFVVIEFNITTNFPTFIYLFINVKTFIAHFRTKEMKRNLARTVSYINININKT